MSRPAALTALLALATFLAAPPAGGRPAPRPPRPVHPLATYTPVEDPGSHALDAFAAALARAKAGKGQARIVVMGASHTAADFYTGHLRRALQARYGDAGHGWVVPGRPWRAYRHSDVNLASSDGWHADRVGKEDARPDGRYGLAGVSVASAWAGDWVRVSTTRDNPVGRRAGLLEVPYLAQPSGGTFEVRVDGRVRAQVPTASPAFEPRTLRLELPDRGHAVEVRPAGDGEVRLFGVVLERRRPGVILDSLGVPGSRAADVLKWDPAVWQEHLRQRRPDLLVMAWGTNEAGDDDQPLEAYESDLRAATERLLAAAPGASCLLVGPTDRPLPLPEGGYVPRPRRGDVTAIQRRVVAERGCAFFDPAALMGGEGGMQRWAAALPPLGSRDRVHLTAEGYQVMGEALLRELLRLAGPGTRRTP